MAKKKKHPEHENLERWLVSYADFITLLFATFVVLYALSQVDISDFKKIEESIQKAFSAPSVMQGADGVMNSSDSLFDTSMADSMITPLMMEYISRRYEEDSMKEIEKSIQEKIRSGELEGIEASMTERGLLIRFKDDYLFPKGSAELYKKAFMQLDIVGATIAKKFILHNMRVEGHTDNDPIHTEQFPSNWELSSARSSSIIRYLTKRFNFMPSLFTAVGFADTRPITSNKTEKGKAKNRRVEILILKNQFKTSESPTNEIAKLTKTEQDQLHQNRMETINRISSISEAAKKLTDGNKKAEEDAIILNQVYNQESKRISREARVLDSNTQRKVTGKGSWLRPPASVEKIHVFSSPKGKN